MHNRLSGLQVVERWLRRHWLLLTVAGLFCGLLLVGQPLLAADVQPEINQTVPPPTPRPTVPSNSGNNNNNSSSNTETQTPVGSSLTQTETATSTLTAVVQVVTLNVRQGPVTTFPVIGKLTQGSTVTVNGRNEAGDWWLICCTADGVTTGWVSAALVAPNFTPEQAASLPVADGSAASGQSISTPTGQQGTVDGVNLNVRSLPSTSGGVIGKLPGGSTVSVLGRNAAADWLYICCVGAPPANGWVSAQFITPTFAAADLAERNDDGTPLASASDAGSAAALSVSVAQQPPFAVQGKEIALVYTVSNAGAEPLTDVVLRSELPGPLTLVAVAAADGGATQEEGSATVVVTWPSVPAGESVSATLRVRVAEDVPNGTTFANLASVTAGSGATADSGITIGMPPKLLVEFW